MAPTEVLDTTDPSPTRSPNAPPQSSASNELPPVRIGTRRSMLARVQTDIVQRELKKAWPDRKYEVHAMATLGDKDQTTALHEFNAKALWTTELEALLESKELDMVVHSLKGTTDTLESCHTLPELTICRHADSTTYKHDDRQHLPSSISARCPCRVSTSGIDAQDHRLAPARLRNRHLVFAPTSPAPPCPPTPQVRRLPRQRRYPTLETRRSRLALCSADSRRRRSDKIGHGRSHHEPAVYGQRRHDARSRSRCDRSRDQER